MLHTKSIKELREGYLKADFSVAEVVESTLSQIRNSNESLNSYISIAGDEIKQSVDAAQSEITKEGENSPLLSGIPIAIKDSIVDTEFNTTCASKMLEKYRSPFDATVVAKLKKQGALIVGKTNLDEFAMGSSTEYSIFGATKNPWNLEHVAGGTSGGSAVAVSSASVPLALGSDTGGSIRQPASFCGVYGLKPTYGRVSRYGLVAHASSFDQIGCLSRNVEDIAIGLEVIAGADAKDSTCSPADVQNYKAELSNYRDGFKNLRIGIPKEYFGEGLDEETKIVVQSALNSFVEQGAELVEVSLPHTEYALATYYIITPAEASSNLARYDGVHYGYRSAEANSLQELYSMSRSESLGPEVKRRILIGSFVLSTGYYDAYYKKAQQVRTLIIDDFRAAFANSCDVIATPTAPTTAFRLGEKNRSPLEMYRADIFTVPASIAGLPALSMPCGKDNTGLPIGMQLIAAPFEESKLLAIAQQFSQAAPADIPAPWDSAS
ncbi:UNVERIFIED_CONTAM: hypothetical protein GTU68_048468 [Idotea baltica]|nr:hypothetical protein [Idotea baltica]